MPIDQGLMTGSAVAEGLSSFATAYNSAKNQAQELAIKERLANAQGLDAFSKLMDTTAGNVISDPNTLGTLKSYGILGPGAGGPDKGYLPPPKPTTLDNTQPATPANPGQAPSGSQYLNHTTPTTPQQQPQQGPQDPFQMEPDAFTKWSMDNLGGQQRKAVQAEYWKRKDPQYQATLSNTVNQRPDELINKFNDHPTIKSANQNTVAYRAFNQAMSPAGGGGKGPGNQELAARLALQIVNDGQPAREGSVDVLKESDPSLYNHYKNIYERAKNNSLSADQIKELNIITANKMIGQGQAVASIQNQFQKDPRNTNGINFGKQDPVYGIAQANLKKFGSMPSSTASQDATGFLTAAKGFLTGKKPDTATANQAFTPDVVNYAKQHKLTNEQALAIKNKRMGK